MTDRDTHSRTAVGHAGPTRHRVGDLLLVFSFLLVPVVWSIQLAAVTSLAGLACLDPNGAAVDWTPVAWAEPAIRWITVAALVLGVAGIGLSLLNMRRSHTAARTPPGGVISADQGRVHWMAFGGFFVAVVTMMAIIANAIPVFWGGLCPV